MTFKLCRLIKYLGLFCSGISGKSQNPLGLVLNYEKMHIKRFCLMMRRGNASWNSGDIQKLSNHAFKSLTGIETRWPSFGLKEETNVAISHLYECLLQIEDEFGLIRIKMGIQS